MKRERGRFTGAVLLAVTVHVLFLSMLVVSFDWSPTPSVPSSPHAIKAVAVNEDQVRSEMERLKREKQQEQAHREAQLKAVQDKIARQKQRLKQIQAQQAAAEHAAAQAAQQRKEEAKRKAQAQRRQQEAAQKQEEAKRLAEQKRQQEEARRQAEQKRKQEEARIAEEKRKQEEAKRLAEEAQRRQAEQALQEQLAAEQAQRDQSVVAQYVGLIKQKVTRNWVRPTGWPAGQTCRIDIQLMPGGDVVQVHMVNSCGSTLFDQSVESAVTRASPLPLPPDGALFDHFREITFNFNPREQE